MAIAANGLATAETIASYDMSTLEITGTASTSPDGASNPGVSAGGFEENLTGGTAASEFGRQDTGFVPAGVNGVGARSLNSSPSNPFWEFTITPLFGATVDLNSLTLDAGAADNLGTDTNWDYDVSTSIDGFAALVGTFDGPSTSGEAITSTGLSVDLSSLADQTTAFTVRITPVRVSGTNGTIGQRAGWIDNVVLDATLTGLPDPFLIADEETAFNASSSVTSLSVPVSNAGTLPLTISAVTPGGTDSANFSVTSSLPLVIPAGGTSTIDVDFTPSVPYQQDYTATLLVASDDSATPSKTLTITVDNAVDPIISAGFPQFVNNGAAQTYSVDIDNLGLTNTLNLSSISVGGTDASTVTGETINIASILPSTTATDAISFTFTPDLGLGQYSFFLVLNSNDPQEPSFEIDVLIDVEEPTISVPTSQDFGSFANNPGAQTQSIFISNEGGSLPLEVTALNLTGSSAFSITSPATLPFSIPAGGSQEVVIIFDPGTQPGTFNGSLEVISNDFGSNEPVVELTATTAAFGTSLAEYTFGEAAATLDLTSSDTQIGSMASDLVETDAGAFTEFGQRVYNGSPGSATAVDGNAIGWSRRDKPNDGLDLTAVAPTDSLAFTLTPNAGVTVDLTTHGWLTLDLATFTGIGGTTAYDFALAIDNGSTPSVLGPVTGLSTAGTGTATTSLTFDVRSLGVLSAPVTFTLMPQRGSGDSGNGQISQAGGYLDNVVLTGEEIIPPDPLLAVTSPSAFTNDGVVEVFSIPIQNVGLGELTITSVTTDGSGDASAFSAITFDTPLSASGGSGTIGFNFDPTSIGEAKTYTTNLTIASNQPGSPTTVALEVTVEDPEGVFPSNLTFNATAHNPVPQTGIIVVSNDGELADLVISGAVISSGSSAFTVTSTPGPIAPGDAGDIEIAFNPGATGGLLEAVLTVTSNDFGNPTTDITLVGFSDPAGTVVARFDFDPSSHVSDTSDVDTDGSLMTDWSTSTLSDLATGIGALSQSNQGENNRNILLGRFGYYLGLSSNRESDAQTPLAAGGDDESTWLTLSVTPDTGGGEIDFTGGSAVVDTYAFTTQGSNTAADWTLYYSLDGGTSWTSLGTLAGAASSSTDLDIAGLSWDLSSIGNQTVAVNFILDAQSTGGVNGSLGQRHVGFDNFIVTAGSVTPGTAADFSTWASGFSIPNDPDYDAGDNDGISALMEYALGLSPIVSESLADTFDTTTGELSFIKGAEAVTNGDVTYAIETSTDLGVGDPWEAVTPDVDDASEISYTLPTGEGKIFARLVVEQPPL